MIEIDWEGMRESTPKPNEASGDPTANIFNLLLNPHHRSRFICSAVRKCIGAFVRSRYFELCDYKIYRGMWHSEGDRLILKPGNDKYPTIEIFFFTHPLMLNAASMRVHHYPSGESSRYSLTTEHLNEADAVIDLARRFLDYTGLAILETKP